MPRPPMNPVIPAELGAELLFQSNPPLSHADLSHAARSNKALPNTAVTSSAQLNPHACALSTSPPIEPPAAEAPPSFFKNRFRGYLPVVIDVETGGFNAHSNALLEIAAVTLKEDQGLLQIDQTYFFAIEPFTGSIITDASLEFNGIVPHSALRGAVSETRALTDLFKHLRIALKQHHCHRAILVGHNAGFDHDFLRAAVARNQIKRDPFHPFSHLDTVSLAMLAYGQSVLTRACKLAQIEFDDKQAHSALYDATKTAELFCLIFNQWTRFGGWPINVTTGH